MKKKRTEPFPWFTMDDGRRVRFDGPRFRDEVDKMKREKRCSGSDVFRGIVLLLYPGYSKDAVENNISTVRKWYDQKNGPRDLLDLYKPLAAHFKIEEDAFLEYEEIKEGHMMHTIGVQTNQTSPNGCLSPVSESKQLIRAMERAKEKEVAHELYGVLVDLIAAYVPVDIDVWVEHYNEWKTWDELQEYLKKYPKRYPVEIAIKKASMYLPRDVRYQANALLEDLYGPRLFAWEENGDIRSGQPAYENQSLLDFRDNKIKQFEEYVKSRGLNSEDLDEGEKSSEMADMIFYEIYDLYDRLDDIFADYLCD